MLCWSWRGGGGGSGCRLPWFGLMIWAFTIWPSRTIASFVLEGSQTSYAQFRQWHGGQNDSLAFEFGLTGSGTSISEAESEKGAEESDGGAEALLLYSDNNQEKEYLQIKLVKRHVMLRYNWGRGGQVISLPIQEGVTWHQVNVIKNGAETTLAVDHSARTLRSNGNHKDSKAKQFGSRKDSDSLAFGDIRTNGYVFVGGLPSWYSEKMDSVVLPTTLLEPRFCGSIRKLKYRDTRSGEEHLQQMMAYKGVRSRASDACASNNPCQNGGKCIATDNGPLCDCGKVDFSGIFCQQESPPPEATFRGTEYITYDLQLRSLEPILSINDELSLYFKTRKSSGLLFYTGNGIDYMNLALQDGGVALTVKLGIGILDTKIKTDSVRFDDNEWHHILVSRESSKVTLTVDGIYTERWMGSGGFSYLASYTAFVGGSEATYSLPGTKTNNNLVGCMKKVTYRADSLVLDFLKLAQDGNPLFSVIGELEWKCQDIGPGNPLAFKDNEGQKNYMQASYYMTHKEQGGVISFTRDEAFLVLPSWKTTISGSISLKFRTNEPHGLLLFNAGGSPGKDFFAMELFEGHLYVHLNLGSGATKVKASRKTLNDNDWHRIELTLKNKQGRITVDSMTEAFETVGASNKLDLVGSLFVGSVDYMDPYLKLPPEVWTARLRHGFVGCLKDLFINGASIDVVTYAHQQDVGSIRKSCHTMKGYCHDRPCMHGGSCTEGWNRYICDCSQTSFSGATCGNSASTLKYTGSESMSLRYSESIMSEADNLSIRFRTVEQTGILVVTRHDRSQDKLEIVLEGGRVKISISIGSTEKTFFVGQSLNDDIYHTLIFERRALKIRSLVDDDSPVIAEIMGTQRQMGYSEMHVGGIEVGSMVTSSSPGFRGSLQQLIFNGQKLFEMANTGLLTLKYNKTKIQNNGVLLKIEKESVLETNTTILKLNAQVLEGNNEETVHHAVSFIAANTYIGLPQMQVYNSINIRLQFRTHEQNGLIFYNAGKASDFIALELVKGRLYYILNLGYGPIAIKDDMGHLSDNKWHTVIIGRPSRYKHTLMVDGHIATATTRGDNYHLDLDGILHLGGVRPTMYSSLPRPLMSKSGFQGCIASFETNGELEDPIKHALVPSPMVEEGCEEAVAYEWGANGGMIKYSYPTDKRPDTSEDVLSLGFISPSFDAVLIRVDSDPKINNDFLQLEINGGKLFLNYNLGAKDITLGDLNTKVNDGRYHVVRFTRSDTNSSMQVDDNPVHTKFPQGTKQSSKMTVFNDQAYIHIGGQWNENLKRVDRPYRGVIAGLTFNGLRPLEKAAEGDSKATIKGDARKLNNIAFDYKEQHPELFTKDAIRMQIDKIYEEKNHGSTHTNGDRGLVIFSNCDDEEDCIQGSGSGDGATGGSSNLYPGSNNPNSKNGENNQAKNNEEVFYPGGTDSRYVPSLVSTPPPYVQYETSTSEHDWYISLYPDQAHTPPPNTNTHIDAFNPPSMLPIPPEEDDDFQDHIDIGIMDAGGGGGSNTGSSNDNNNNKNVIKDYDTKWNEGEDSVEEMEEEDNESSNDYPDIVEKQMPSTMVLVIGIIVGAFVAMILIVIIVLKIRVRVDQPKCESSEAAPRYQFAPPNDYGEVGAGGEQETATTSLMEGSVAPPLVSLGPSTANVAASGGIPGSGVPGGGVGGPAALSGGVGAGLYNNGMFTNNNCASRPLQPPPPSSNGDRSRLFRKSNGSKPVREWYV